MRKFVIIDLFCGAGGTSLGFHRAKYNGENIAEVVACVNHDAMAIKSHSKNFPECQHFTEDVRTLDVTKLPRKEPGDNRIWVLWASLECTHFSNAKTGARNADSRTLAHALYPYIQHINPDLVQIENVREFMSWGELDEAGKPINRKKGIHYVQWRQEVESMGYRYQSKLLNSADYGSYQSRLRYFAVFAKPQMPIVFPEPSHDRTAKNGLPKWKAVRDVLELEKVGVSIFHRKKALSPNTMKRILAGLVKFVGNGEGQYIIRSNGGDAKDRVRSTEVPLNTLTTSPNSAIVSPEFLIRHYGGEPQSKSTSLDNPAPTITTRPHESLVHIEKGFLLQYNGQPDQSVTSLSVPSRTLTCRDRFGLTSCAFIDNQFGTGRPSGIGEPSHTLMAVPKQRLVTAQFLMATNFNNQPTSLDNPSPTITANRKWHYLVSPQFNSAGGDIDKPCFTLIAKMDKRPPSIITAEEIPDANLTGETRLEYYRDDTHCPTDRILAFMADHGISDIFMRMLNIPELKRIQGFDDDYILLGTQDQQKKFIGNAVEPKVVKAWVLRYFNEINNLFNHQLTMFQI